MPFHSKCAHASDSELKDEPTLDSVRDKVSNCCLAVM